MRDLFEWLRFCEYDGDMGHLHLLKNEQYIQFQKQHKNQSESSDDD